MTNHRQIKSVLTAKIIPDRGKVLSSSCRDFSRAYRVNRFRFEIFSAARISFSRATKPRVSTCTVDLADLLWTDFVFDMSFAGDWTRQTMSSRTLSQAALCRAMRPSGVHTDACILRRRVRGMPAQRDRVLPARQTISSGDLAKRTARSSDYGLVRLFAKSLIVAADKWHSDLESLMRGICNRNRS